MSDDRWMVVAIAEDTPYVKYEDGKQAMIVEVGGEEYPDSTEERYHGWFVRIQSYDERPEFREVVHPLRQAFEAEAGRVRRIRVTIEVEI